MISQEEYVQFRDESAARQRDLEAKLHMTKGKMEWVTERIEMLAPLVGVTKTTMLSVIDTVFIGEDVTVKFKAERFLKTE